MLMSPPDRAVDHQILIIAIGRQRFEYPPPDTGMAQRLKRYAPSPIAMAFQQVAPMGARAPSPKTTIDE
jgi:hypothetical protein